MQQSGQTSIEKIVAPTCSRCGSETRLFGIEGQSDCDVLTFICKECEGVETEILPRVIVNAA